MEIKTGSYNSIQNEWKYLYDRCTDTTVYQSPDVIGKVANSIPYTIKLRSKAHFIVVKENDAPIMACGYRNLGKDSVAMIGTLENFDHSDIVFDASCTQEQLGNALKEIRSQLKKDGKTHLLWDYVIEGSHSYRLISDVFDNNAKPHYNWETLNVRINIGDKTYEDYFSSLSKQTRQNYRTSVNRLKTDGLDLGGGISVYISNDYKDTKNTIHSEYMALYLSRLSEHYHCSWLQRLFRKYAHYISITCREGAGYMCDIRIDGKVAAMMRGYFDEKRKSIAVPCLAIDNINYKRYSPGVIMIQKFIEYLRTNYPDIQYLDLERGTEGYKLKMGGEPYKLNCYKIEL